jgi:hypothetical protein
MRTVAMVESPTQLLNVIEWASQAQADPARITVLVLAPTDERSRLQLRSMVALARANGLCVTWHEPRHSGTSLTDAGRSLGGALTGVQRLVIGDPFSGVMQVVLSICTAPEVVIVDDGTATMEFARQWMAGERLARWHQVAQPGHRQQITRFARGQIAASVRRRIGPGSGCRLSVFTCLPVQLGQIPIVRNRYAWTRARFRAPQLKPAADLIGTSLVETGVVQVDAYLHGVATLAAQHGINRYFAHRKEASAKLDQIASLGLEIARPDLPLEIAARNDLIGARVISFPSTLVHTLPQVLADTCVELLVCDIAGEWLTPQAAPRSAPFLHSVTSSARRRYGLTAVAC